MVRFAGSRTIAIGLLTLTSISATWTSLDKGTMLLCGFSQDFGHSINQRLNRFQCEFGGWQRNARKRDARIPHVVSSYISALFSSRFFERYLKKVLLPTPAALHTSAAHRESYLQRANLIEVADFRLTPDTLKKELEKQYDQTNQRILSGENPHVHFRKDGSFYVRTPKAEKEDSEPLLGVLPKKRYISLLEVMATVNRFTNFLDAFEPWRIKYNRAKPPDRTFFAGIIGYVRCAHRRLRLTEKPMFHRDSQDCEHFIGYC